MKREIEAEWLDSLPADDKGAVGSRRDLRRLNSWMGHGRIVARTLGSAWNGQTPRRIVELGAGDGELMLDLARRLTPRWPDASVVLVDQQETVAAETRQAMKALGWDVECVKADVFDWLRQPTEHQMAWEKTDPSPQPSPLPKGRGRIVARSFASRSHQASTESGVLSPVRAPDSSRPRNDVVVANLFLHHFDNDRLAELLRGIARMARVFVAVEPRRSRWSFAFSRQLWAIGCNRVTRHDAPVSVRAGFAGKELSRLWPADGCWALEERPAGWFSHLFVARRKP